MKSALKEEEEEEDNITHLLFPLEVWKRIFTFLYDEIRHLIYQQSSVSKEWFLFLMSSITRLEAPFMKQVQCHLKLDDNEEDNMRVLLKWEGFLSNLVDLKYIDIQIDDQYGVVCPLKLVLCENMIKKQMFNDIVSFSMSNISDPINTVLPLLKSLKWLSMNKCDVKDGCLQKCEFPLFQLNLVKCRFITGKLFKESKWCKELNCLYLYCENNNEILTNVVVSMENLHILYVESSKCGGFSYQKRIEFGLLKRLDVLNLNDGQFDYSDPSFPSSLPTTLTSLRISPIHEEESIFISNGFMHLTALKYLRIDDFCEQAVEEYELDWTKILPDIRNISIHIEKSNTRGIKTIRDLYSENCDFVYLEKEGDDSFAFLGHGLDDEEDAAAARKVICIIRKEGEEEEHV